MLSCSCFEIDDAELYYYPPNDFSKLSTKRARRCSSCKALIPVGSTCLKFTRERCAKDDIEYRIYGDGPEIVMPPWFLCEACGEIYLNLEAAGFCLCPQDDMRENLREYWELSKFKPPDNRLHETEV